MNNKYRIGFYALAQPAVRSSGRGLSCVCALYTHAKEKHNKKGNARQVQHTQTKCIIIKEAKYYKQQHSQSASSATTRTKYKKMDCDRATYYDC